MKSNEEITRIKRKTDEVHFEQGLGILKFDLEEFRGGRANREGVYFRK